MKFEVSEVELGLARLALEVSSRTYDTYSSLMPVKLKSHPIPFFGPISRSRVITLGLNPSSLEFVSQRNWPEAITADYLAKRLTNYWSFEGTPPHAWFQPWSQVLAELGVSYPVDAAHLDLSARATNSQKGNLKPLFVKMLQSDAQIWIGGLTCATNCKLVLAAGTATKNHYVNEFIQKVLPHSDIKLNGKWRRSSGPGQWAEHTIRIANGKDIPFFFCSTGPSNGGGPTLVSTFRERTNMLRQYLA